jgi:hypothetical protein
LSAPDKFICPIQINFLKTLSNAGFDRTGQHFFLGVGHVFKEEIFQSLFVRLGPLRIFGNFIFSNKFVTVNSG